MLIDTMRLCFTGPIISNMSQLGQKQDHITYMANFMRVRKNYGFNNKLFSFPKPVLYMQVYYNNKIKYL